MNYRLYALCSILNIVAYLDLAFYLDRYFYCIPHPAIAFSLLCAAYLAIMMLLNKRFHAWINANCARELEKLEATFKGLHSEYSPEEDKEA